jgi:uncharacterized membrane protein YeaQ/YmgE (transglycosylase-associated protein family)
VSDNTDESALMGWIGTFALGLAIGWFAWWRHPSRAGGPVFALAAAAVGAIAVKLVGNATGLFDDGEILEWLLSVLGALTAATLAVSLGATRFRR